MYLRTKFQVSSIILTSFRKGVILPPPPPLQNRPIKSPPRLGLNDENKITEVTSPGPSIKLVQKSQKRKIQLCIICRKVQDNQQSKKLTSTRDGRSLITQISRVLGEDSLVELTHEYLHQYHSRYAGSGEREVSEKRSNSESCMVSELSSPESRHRRQITLVESEARKKISIICDKVKSKGSNEWFRIEWASGNLPTLHPIICI